MLLLWLRGYANGKYAQQLNFRITTPVSTQTNLSPDTVAVFSEMCINVNQRKFDQFVFLFLCLKEIQDLFNPTLTLNPVLDKKFCIYLISHFWDNNTSSIIGITYFDLLRKINVVLHFEDITEEKLLL